MYRWRTKDEYEGPWVFDKMNGKGIFTWADGRREECTFRDDAKVFFKDH
jgi:hypothetical protein